MLGLLGGLGPLTIHIIVPVLPMIAHNLRMDTAEVQVILSLYLVGLAGGQLFLGALSDNVGRRPILLFGLLIYCVSTGAETRGLPAEHADQRGPFWALTHMWSGPGCKIFFW
ncbi:MFS transporter [Bradyrhizobium sp. I1.7.5]|uniref:MFS transporter n=1 Tax=Bradyrhizobium sp. I1.7.5 TaxID=3156363 RepID=UPI003396AE75